jgi:osmotically-inducible protein OsmY
MSLVIDRGSRSSNLAEQSSDRTIVEAATLRLQMSPYMPLRVVRCECNHGVLTLAGRVPSFYHRQMAQQHVRSVAGVNQIDDQLQVQTP